MFADLVGFTDAARGLPPEEIVEFLDQLVRSFDALSEQLGVEKIKTIGDSYMAASGFDGAASNGAVAIGRLALAILRSVDRQPPLEGRKLKLRIGIHCGRTTYGEGVGRGWQRTDKGKKKIRIEDIVQDAAEKFGKSDVTIRRAWQRFGPLERQRNPK